MDPTEHLNGTPTFRRNPRKGHPLHLRDRFDWILPLCSSLR
ncbi:hypothetical protein MUK42_32621 [Musa troglodytarum]|uniref:Uncharacterized protein n=1 Tax=Musa troglodytarum TaxID=320322 RepID=A0A9E7F4T6_9LILI|nr:hypothetical protein MUK42_32621 [Musa troglodytarum]